MLNIALLCFHLKVYSGASEVLQAVQSTPYQRLGAQKGAIQCMSVCPLLGCQARTWHSLFSHLQRRLHGRGCIHFIAWKHTKDRTSLTILGAQEDWRPHTKELEGRMDR